MSQFNLNGLYEEGLCKNLDKKIREYQKVRIWRGQAFNNLLTKKEVDVMAELWRKERMTRTRMTFHELSTLMVWFLSSKKLLDIKFVTYIFTENTTSQVP